MTHSIEINNQTAGLMSDEEEDESYIDYFYDEPGKLPGSLNLSPNAPDPEMVLIDYNEYSLTHSKVNQPEELIPYLDTESVSWVDILDLGNEDIWQRMAKIFDLHPIALEDIVNVPQRPKVVEYDNQLIIISCMVTPKESDTELFYREQVSLVLGKHYLLTVQEEPDFDCFTRVRDRIRNNKGTIRKQGPDYLAYALLDAIIDGYFPVLENYGEHLEDLEDEVVINPTPKTLNKIYKIKRDLLTLRRSVWPQRDAINNLIRDESEFISPEVRVYLRDCYDHIIQVMDLVESYRELAAGLMDVYLSSVSNKMNEVMKFLTVISSIFIPLTFVAGIYGMNFNTDKSPWNMPELNWHFGYPLCLGLMLGISVFQVYFFWKRGWFNNFSGIKDDEG